MTGLVVLMNFGCGLGFYGLMGGLSGVLGGRCGAGFLVVCRWCLSWALCFFWCLLGISFLRGVGII